METNVTINVNTKSVDEAIQKMNQLVKLLKETEQISNSKATSNLLKEKKMEADKEQVIEMLKKQMELLSNCSNARTDITYISIAMKVLAEFILNPNSSSTENRPQD